MVACITTCWVLCFYCNGTALSVLSRGVVDRVIRDVIERCVVPQNPGEAIPRSADQSDAESFLRSGECTMLTYFPSFT